VNARFNGLSLPGASQTWQHPRWLLGRSIRCPPCTSFAIGFRGHDRGPVRRHRPTPPAAPARHTVYGQALSTRLRTGIRTGIGAASVGGATCARWGRPPGIRIGIRAGIRRFAFWASALASGIRSSIRAGIRGRASAVPGGFLRCRWRGRGRGFGRVVEWLPRARFEVAVAGAFAAVGGGIVIK